MSYEIKYGENCGSIGKDVFYVGYSGTGTDNILFIN